MLVLIAQISRLCEVSNVSSDTVGMILCVQARSLLGMIVEAAEHDGDIELGGLRGSFSMYWWFISTSLLFPPPFLQLILDS